MAFKLSVSVEDKAVRGVLSGLGAAAADLRPAMDNIGRMLMTSVDMRFERESDPDGAPWVVLAPSTIKRKAKAGRERKLQWSGALRRSITRQADSSSVTVGSNLVYAAIQQNGGTIEKYAQSREILRKFTETGGVKTLHPGFVKRSQANFASFHEVGAHGITIPARPFLGINAADEAEGVQILKDHLGLSS